jgi:vacuolar-type H+-ATPase subunit H
MVFKNDEASAIIPRLTAEEVTRGCGNEEQKEFRRREESGMNGEPKKTAALEALQKVKEAEERALTIIQEAREKLTQEIIRKASEEAEKIKMRALARAKEEAEAYRKTILEKAADEAKAIRAEAEEEAAGIRRRAAELLDEAVKKTSLKVKEFLQGRSV